MPCPLHVSIILSSQAFKQLEMTITTTIKDTEVVIVGAGPVGLFVALMIAKAGIKCILLEALGEIIQSPRAMAYGPAAVQELERAGVAQECREIGMEPSDYEFTLRWITLDNKLVADLSSQVNGGISPVLCGQHQVAGVILKHLQKFQMQKFFGIIRLSGSTRMGKGYGDL